MQQDTALRVDSVEVFDTLATKLNARPEQYQVLGDAYLDIAFVMRRPDNSAFRIRVCFEDLSITKVAEIAEGEEENSDCWLEADLSVWEAMFANIREHGQATGMHTVNALTMRGVDMQLRGSDPMGVDRFSRFNQTLQWFLEGSNYDNT